MEKHSEQPDLIKTIDEIKAVEEKHDRMIAAAKEEAEKILRKAKEKIAEERIKVEEELTAYKNEKLKSESRAIEGEIAEILSKAKRESEQLRKKKADAKKLEKIYLSLFE